MVKNVNVNYNMNLYIKLQTSLSSFTLNTLRYYGMCNTMADASVKAAGLVSSFCYFQKSIIYFDEVCWFVSTKTLLFTVLN